MDAHREPEKTPPTPDEVDEALQAFWQGSHSEFDRLMGEDEANDSSLCSVFHQILGIQPEDSSRHGQADPPADSEVDPYAAGAIPKEIGDYRIQRVIGCGGMGTVYEAFQEHPRRTVALKVMKEGIASRSALRRFEYESQILARLRHPCIAQVYAAGTHRQEDKPDSPGVPYFAMEYIPNARPITHYQREKRLGSRDRLELFKQVCDAVHHGHQKGIIHRDLKPANILVDSHGHVKIIDFGVARATDSDLAVTTLQTDVGQLVGTVQYMSPEQVEADPHDIDIRSDVYSLGLVLYELLTDRLPYDVHKVPIYEATRLIREQPPTKLSTIDRMLRGDIETIVLKALEKDRERRYQSADELRRDIDHYLKGQPISARPPSVRYQLSIFARRNKVLVTSVALVFLILVFGIVATTSMYFRAETARLAEQEQRDEARIAARRAEMVNEFLEGMLSSADPRNVGPNMPVREVLDKAAAGLGAELESQPEIRAALHDTLGRSYMALRLYDQADVQLTQALDMRVDLYGERHPLTASTLNQVGMLRRQQRRLDESEEHLRRAYRIRLELFGEEHPDVAESLHALAFSHVQLPGYKDAEALFRGALTMRQKLLGEHRSVAETLEDLGTLLVRAGRFEEGEPLLQEALELRRKLFGNDHFNVATSLTFLGEIYFRRGDYAKAESLHREQIRILRGIFGAQGNRDLAYALSDLANVAEAQGRLDEAEPLYRESVTMARRVTSEDGACLAVNNFAAFLRDQGRYREAEPLSLEVYRHWKPVSVSGCYAAQNLALVLMELGRHQEAEALFREAERRWRTIHNTNHPKLAVALTGLGRLMMWREDFSTAERYFREALVIRQKRLGKDNPEIAVSMIHLAGVLHVLGQPGAEAMHDEALRLLREEVGDRHPHVVWAINRLARSKLDEGDHAASKALFREAVEIERRHPRRKNPDLAHSMAGIADVLVADGSETTAEPLLREALEIQRVRFAKGDRRTALTQSALGACLTAQGRFDEAEPLLVDAHAIIEASYGTEHPETRRARQRITDLHDSREKRAEHQPQ